MKEESPPWHKTCNTVITRRHPSVCLSVCLSVQVGHTPKYIITRLAFQLPIRKVPGSNTGSEAAPTDFHFIIQKYKKGKAVPLQAWSGPEGSRKLRFPDFMTTAQDGGKVVSLTHRPPLPPGNTPGTRFCWGRAVAYYLQHCATNRQVAGSIPDGVIGIFQWHNPSGRTMALGSTQPLTEMSTRCISWGERQPVLKAELSTILCRCHEVWEP